MISGWLDVLEEIIGYGLIVGILSMGVHGLANGHALPAVFIGGFFIGVIGGALFTAIAATDETNEQ